MGTFMKKYVMSHFIAVRRETIRNPTTFLAVVTYIIPMDNGNFKKFFASRRVITRHSSVNTKCESRLVDQLIIN